MSTNWKDPGSLDEFISPDGYLASSAQKRTAVQPIQMAPARKSVGVLVFKESFKSLGQQPRNGSLPLESNQLDFEQNGFGKRQSDVLS